MLPVDVWVPACLPSPHALLHGLGVVAAGRLAEKVLDRSFTVPDYPERDRGDSYAALVVALLSLGVGLLFGLTPEEQGISVRRVRGRFRA